MDTIVQKGASVLQHGKYNDRVYLMRLAHEDCPGIIEHVNQLAAENEYSKIFVKAPAFAENAFCAKGFETEGKIPGFYRGEEDAVFMSKFLTNQRAAPRNKQKRRKVLDYCRTITPLAKEPALPREWSVSACTIEEIDEMANVYRQVFDSYPFPIFDPDYLRHCFDNDVIFFSIKRQGAIVALSSAELDRKASAAEMTDFATLPEHRGKGLATALLSLMEKEIAARSIMTAYTIARAKSFGMNAVFAKRAYQYGGTLINNTNIGGSIESMNIWYKRLDSAIMKHSPKSSIACTLLLA